MASAKFQTMLPALPIASAKMPVKHGACSLGRPSSGGIASTPAEFRKGRCRAAAWVFVTRSRERKVEISEGTVSSEFQIGVRANEGDENITPYMPAWHAASEMMTHNVPYHRHHYITSHYITQSQ